MWMRHADLHFRLEAASFEGAAKLLTHMDESAYAKKSQRFC